MESCTRNSGLMIEPLEQRRLLCGDLPDAAAGHAPAGVAATAADDATAGTAGRNDATGHVVAAVARSTGGMRGGRVVWGETTEVGGALLGTWAVVSRRDGEILAAGATVSLALSQNMPQQPGPFPRGAFASLDFPAVARDATYLNHLEVHTEANGHIISPLAVDRNRFRPAHFDFHFYNIPEAQVWAIPGREPPGLPQVPADRLPAGFAQPGRGEPQMGRHALHQSELTTPGPFSDTMIAGFLPDASKMHFIEPMITRDKLLEAEDFALAMPMPQTFDFDALYPTRFQAVFQGGAHHFVFSDFIDTDPATPSGDTEPAYVPAPRQAAAGASGQAVKSADWLFAEGDEQDDGEEDTDDGEDLADVVH